MSLETSRERIKAELKLCYAQKKELTESYDAINEIREAFFYEMAIDAYNNELDSLDQHMASLEWALQQIH